MTEHNADLVRGARVVEVCHFQPTCDRCGYRGSLYVLPKDARLVVEDHNHRHHGVWPCGKCPLSFDFCRCPALNDGSRDA